MLTDLVLDIFLPSFIFGILFAVIHFYLSSYKHWGLPKALANGFAGSKYVLTRGRKHGISDFFYDIDASLTNHKDLDAILKYYTSSINEIQNSFGRIDKLAFIEKDSGPVGTISLLGVLTRRLKLSSIIIRPRRRLDLNSIKGDLGYKDRIVILSDIATSGGGIKAAVKKLSSKQAKVIAAVVLVNRMTKEDMEDLALPLYCAFRINEKSDLEKEPIRSFIYKKMEDQSSESQLDRAAA
jgi:orotate phosphoribosyltransferase